MFTLGQFLVAGRYGEFLFNMKLSHNKPEIYEKCKQIFGVDWDRGVVITYGDTVYSKNDISEHTIVHEETHIKQQKEMGPEKWWEKYFIDKELTVKGVFGRRIWDTWYQVSELLKSQKVDLTKMITHRFAFKDFEKAIKKLSVIMKKKKVGPLTPAFS